MENYLEYEPKLDQLLLTFDCARKASDEGCETYGLALLACPKDFKGRFSRCLLSAKKKILEIIVQKLTDLKETNVSTLKCFIKSLVLPSQVLLNDLILNLYTGMVDLAQSSKKVETQLNNIGNNQSFTSLLKAIIKQLSPLLFYFFVNKEYKKRLKSISTYVCCSHSKINSQKSISCKDSGRNKNQMEHQESGQVELINKIYEQFQSMSIPNLIEKYLKEQQNLIVDSIEVCRVCSQKVKLKNFQKHVKICSKKAKMESDLNQLQVKRKKLQESVKQLEKQIIRKTEEPTQRDKHILKILTMLKNAFLSNKKQGGIKRNTFIGGIKSQPIEDIKFQLQQFQKNYQPDELISSFVKSKQEIILIRKKILTVQMSEKIEDDSKHDSDISSIKSLEYSINNAKSSHRFKTKKSLFANASNQNSKVQKRSKSGNKSESQSQSQSDSSSSKSENISISSGNSIQKSSSNFLTVNKHGNKDKDRSPSHIELMKRSGPLPRYPFEEISRNQIKSMRNFHPIEDTKQTVGLSDFQVLKILGKGAFGQVYLVRRKTTCDLYALKHIKFEENQTELQLNLIKKQHQIFKKIGGDHLIRAPFAFSQSSGHFFVLQFMPGGDLSKILSENVYLEEDHAKFYLAEIVLALQHLHKCEIIHRDLKPQNIVIQKSGHIKLTDFGLSDIKIQDKLIKAKQKLNLNQRRATMQRAGRRVALVNKTDIAKIIGTPDYIAPQIINQTSINNQSIDWWSLGVMAYEMLVGCRPFSALTIEEVLKNILDCKIQWPQIGREQDMMSPQAYDLISRLLDKNFQKRIGSFSCQQIKNHPFFQGIDWENIKHEKPPILPYAQLDHLKEYMNLEEDKQLLAEIMNSGKSELNRSKKINGLQNFVRYDVLMEETYKSIDQKLMNQKKKMERIKNASSFLQKESGHILTDPCYQDQQVDVIKIKEAYEQNLQRILQSSDQIQDLI